ncbi:hypothetical protein KO525_02925 [Psychrosphaera sp. B3R10]|uniref:RHS repeat-associated core domain-containing protein n=1 Tax=Psychrosphaera sp. B3R10 TaxID=2841569 RepID=UPI001C0955F3|nr:RHS repeat-associated core domain-containing protein [Psychrosphaera sp. B3R10]MBU2988326.1 hypothetical protein [Psychrosphaera sp. B3R10]
MNGRIYDPTLGRFLQADPFIQAPSNLQNYNRYSYVLNNPMSYTDPSGYFFSSFRRGLIKAATKIFGKDVVNIVGSTVSAVYGGGWGAAAWTYEFNRAMGVPPSGALRAAAVAGASAYTFQQIGDYYSGAGASNIAAVEAGNMSASSLTNFGGNMLTSGQIAGQIASHAFAGGTLSVLGGGKFGHGFVSAGFTKGVGTGLNTHYNSGPISGTIISMTVGGTSSVLTGGKFGNGAMTAMYQSLFNEFGQGDLQKRLNSELAYWDKKTTNFFNDLFGNSASLTGTGAVHYGIEGVSVDIGQIMTTNGQSCSVVQVCDRLGLGVGGSLGGTVAMSPANFVTEGTIQVEGYFLETPIFGASYLTDGTAGYTPGKISYGWIFAGGYQQCSVTVSNCN